jgi:hypothetical protein
MTWPARIDTALRELARAESPLRASSGEGGGGSGISDPTGKAALEALERSDYDDPAAIRRRLIAAVHRREDDANTIHAILGRWAVQTTDSQVQKQIGAINDSMWCANHLAHKQFEARRGNGSRFCTWCAEVQRSYGKLPTLELIRAHDAGRRLTDRDYVAALKGKRKKKAA